MKESKASMGDKVVLGLQIFLLVAFYIFAAGVFTFLGSAVYRSVINNDHPAHAVILGSVITLAFLILTSVVTMVFTTIIKEGRKKVPEHGGSFNESKI
jgi:heme/copper-type cytochrome/quinol oxidase subunit 3